MRSETCTTPQTASRLPCRVDGSGPSMVLLHGGTGSRTHWDWNFEALTARFRVHAFDLPGFGDSPNVPKDLDPERYLDWVAAEIARVPGKIHLAGFSFGGAVAAAVARRLRDRMARLSLLGPGGFGIPAGRSLPLLPMPRGNATEAERRKVIAHNLGVWMLAKAPDPDDPVVDIQMRNIERARYDSRRVSLRATLLSDISAIDCPVQVIWGTNDRLAYPSIEERMRLCREVRPDAEFHVIPDAGHWVQFEAPAAVSSKLISFHSQETLA